MNHGATLGELVQQLHQCGIRRVRSFAWRDLADSQAGGSEVHADEILGRWAAAGLRIEHRTSTDAVPDAFTRRGYQVTRRGGRMGVFAQVVGREIIRRTPADTAVVEIWNGVPWLSPLWQRGPRVVWMHHVHEHMWAEVLPAPLAVLGRMTETRLAPPFYRRTRLVTLADPVAEEIAAIGIPRAHISVIPPGVDPRFTPDAGVARDPGLVVVAARLAPAKRVDSVLEAVAAVRRRGRPLRVEVIGEGPERPQIEAWITAHGAAAWVTLRGRVSFEELRATYQRARLVVSASHAEGWGMVLTEAAACGTPAVATDIPGHRGAVLAGVTGDLVELEDLADTIDALLADTARWGAYSRAALQHAASLSWDAVATRHLELLLAEARAAQRGGTLRPAATR